MDSHNSGGSQSDETAERSSRTSIREAFAFLYRHGIRILVLGMMVLIVFVVVKDFRETRVTIEPFIVFSSHDKKEYPSKAVSYRLMDEISLYRKSIDSGSFGLDAEKFFGSDADLRTEMARRGRERTRSSPSSRTRPRPSASGRRTRPSTWPTRRSAPSPRSCSAASSPCATRRSASSA